MENNINKEDLKKNLSKKDLETVEAYQKIHARIGELRSQMDEIKNETHSLIQKLDQMRNEDNKNNK